MRNSINLFLRNITNITVVIFAIPFFSIQAHAQNETVAEEITVPYPTIINLAIEWKIQGDDNQNGLVNIQFRDTRNLNGRINIQEEFLI